MHDLKVAGLHFRGAAAAPIHTDEFDLEPPIDVEPAGLGHPHRQHRIHRIGNSNLQLGKLRSDYRGHPPFSEKQTEKSGERAR